MVCTDRLSVLAVCITHHHPWQFHNTDTHTHTQLTPVHHHHHHHHPPRQSGSRRTTRWATISRRTTTRTGSRGGPRATTAGSRARSAGRSRVRCICMWEGEGGCRWREGWALSVCLCVCVGGEVCIWVKGRMGMDHVVFALNALIYIYSCTESVALDTCMSHADRTEGHTQHHTRISHTTLTRTYSHTYTYTYHPPTQARRWCRGRRRSCTKTRRPASTPSPSSRSAHVLGSIRAIIEPSAPSRGWETND
jgi:hypothetical protein